MANKPIPIISKGIEPSKAKPAASIINAPPATPRALAPFKHPSITVNPAPKTMNEAAKLKSPFQMVSIGITPNNAIAPASTIRAFAAMSNAAEPPIVPFILFSTIVSIANPLPSAPIDFKRFIVSILHSMRIATAKRISEAAMPNIVAPKPLGTPSLSIISDPVKIATIIPRAPTAPHKSPPFFVIVETTFKAVAITSIALANPHNATPEAAISVVGQCFINKNNSEKMIVKAYMDSVRRSACMLETFFNALASINIAIDIPTNVPAITESFPNSLLVDATNLKESSNSVNRAETAPTTPSNLSAGIKLITKRAPAKISKLLAISLKMEALILFCHSVMESLIPSNTPTIAFLTSANGSTVLLKDFNILTI